MTRKTNAFTIVELLIVIVVIAVLAAISVVAYRGIQQRANNTAIINAASQTVRAIQAYIASEGAYPATSYFCVTTESGCANSGGVIPANATFNTNMQKTGSAPTSTATLSGTTRYGVMYNYDASRTLDGQSRPAVLLYYLDGISQSCGMVVTDALSATMLTSSNPYTGPDSGGTGKTACVVSIPGPAV